MMQVRTQTDFVPVQPRLWSDKRFHTWNYEMREQFNGKVFKVMLDAGFTCPNRDGSIAAGGCTFCSARGSGDFAGSRRDDLSYPIQQNSGSAASKMAGSAAILVIFKLIRILMHLYEECGSTYEAYFAAAWRCRIVDCNTS